MKSQSQGQVVVTGASRGIGRALCLELAAQGYPLVASARSEPELESLAGEVRERFGSDCTVVACDLTTPDGRVELTARAATTGVPTVGLVNNAGFGTAGLFAQIDREKDLQMLALNVAAPVDLCHRFLPQLRGQLGAFILNVASTAAFQPVPLFSTYAATKAFLLSFSEALAEEVAREGIHVMTLCPGPTVTGFQQAADVLAVGNAASAQEVAVYAARALAARQRVAVHGAMNAVQVFATRLAPRRLLTKIAWKVMEPWFAGRAKRGAGES